MNARAGDSKLAHNLRAIWHVAIPPRECPRSGKDTGLVSASVLTNQCF